MHCPGCGAPVAPGAAFCTYCGATLPTAPTAPLASTVPPWSTGPVPAAPGYPFAPIASPPHPPKRRSRLIVAVVVVVVVLLVVGVIAFIFLASPAPPVQVEDIFVYSPDNVCGLEFTGVYYQGFNGSTGENQTLEFGVENYNSTSCTVHVITTNTTGFKLYHPQVPRKIGPGATEPLNITIISPSTKFVGNLNLIFR